MIEEIKKELLGIKDRKYKDFSSKLLPGVNNVLGVRLPILRNIAKRIYKDKKSLEYINNNTQEFFELTMIEGMIIGHIKDYSQAIQHIENFIPKINNWSVCDSFCCSLNIVKKNKDNFKLFLEQYFLSKEEYKLRFCYVILLNYYIDELDYIFSKIIVFKDENYYSKMAVAWLLSYCFIKDFNKTLEFIKNNRIQEFAYKKGITKAIESYRITKEQKEILRKIKNKAI